MKNKVKYFILLVLYFLLGGIVFFKSSMIGSKTNLLILLISVVIVWIGTIYYMEKENIIASKSKKIGALFNYFDYDRVKDLIRIKKTKKEGYEVFKGSDDNQSVTILAIKILNYEGYRKLDDDARINGLAHLLDIIETNIKKRFGIIYNINKENIYCIFNTIYELEDPAYEAMLSSLNINLDLMQERESDEYLSKIKLDMSIVNEDMDFFIRDKRVLLSGSFDLSEDLLNISGSDAIYITDDIYRKYEKQIDTDYLGKFYLSKDVKVYKLIKMIDCSEEITQNTYNSSKINIKKSKMKKFKKFIKETNSKKIIK